MGDPLLGEVQYEHEDAESTCVTEPIQDDNGSPDAYTFFNFEDDDDDGDAENDEEEEEEEKEEVVFQQVQYKAYRPEYSTIYYAYRVPGDGGSSSDDSSTLASQRSDRSFTQSSSSSISGRHQHPEKAARILGLDQESLRSFRTFPSSYSTDNYNFGFRQKNTSTDLLKPSDAALASYLNTVGWDSRILKDTDTLNEDVSTATLDAAWVWNALNGENTPDTSLLDSRVVEISYELNRIVRMRERYLELYEVDVLAEIQARTHGVHRTALLCLMGGPYESDARIFDRNDFSFLFDQELMAEALFAKEPDEIRLLASHFFRIHGYSLRSAIEGIFETPIYQRLRTAYYKVDSVRSEAFGRACVRALSADREVESLESLESMTPTEMLIREHQLFDDVEQLYQMDLVLRCRVLDHHLLLELVLTKSKLYLDELCRRFSKQHGIELTDTLSAMGWTAHGTLDVYPPGLVSSKSLVFLWFHFIFELTSRYHIGLCHKIYPSWRFLFYPSRRSTYRQSHDRIRRLEAQPRTTCYSDNSCALWTEASRR